MITRRCETLRDAGVHGHMELDVVLIVKLAVEGK
jgi:hypothetical protein